MIKRVRELTGWGLNQVIKVVDRSGVITRIRSNLSHEDAVAIKESLEEAGATILVEQHR